MPCAEPSTLRGISLPQTAFVPAFKKGANCAVVVADKVYTLDSEGSSGVGRTEQAWQQAKVTGTAN
jgi:hypothetical protein